MSSLKTHLFFGVSMIIACGLCTSKGVAEAFSLTVQKTTPPAELSEEIRGTLAPSVHAVSNEDGVLFEFWFVEKVMVEEFGESSKESLENIEGTALLGAVKVHHERYDFRDNPIDPGVYTMRLGLQPKDGNHLGTAPFDTFAILVSHAHDKTLGGMRDHEKMVEIAMEDTVGAHPPVLSLQPMKSGDDNFPLLSKNEDKEWDFLSIKLPLESGKKQETIAVQLSFHGIGEI